jgi:hypothetical protein
VSARSRSTPWFRAPGERLEREKVDFEQRRRDAEEFRWRMRGYGSPRVTVHPGVNHTFGV